MNASDDDMYAMQMTPLDAIVAIGLRRMSDAVEKVCAEPYSPILPDWYKEAKSVKYAAPTSEEMLANQIGQQNRANGQFGIFYLQNRSHMIGSILNGLWP